MMNQTDYGNSCVDILEQQLAIDYDCTVEEIRSIQNVYRGMKKTAKMRPIGDINCMFKMAIYNEKLLVMADERILEWCRETFGEQRGTWMSEPQSLIMIHNKLQEYGQRLADIHHHYIPDMRRQQEKVQRRFDVRFYEAQEIEVFRNDDRFWEALLFNEDTPDMLAVCAMDGDTILGMASATRDCKSLWQIGVNVTKEGQGKGIGAYVTAILKEALLERGIIPTYATVESHIKSQRVALQAGFEPAFFEMFSELC